MDEQAQLEARTDEEPKVLGMLAEFKTPDELLRAARKVREEGYEHFDAHSPYPIHGLDEAMKIRPTILPWLVLGGGITGASVALLMQWWTNAVDYPHIISGKPLFSLPANIPVIFELTVLFSALTAFFGHMVLNRLGRPSRAIFSTDRFQRATSDRFFLSIEARGYKFDRKETKALLESLGAASVETVVETETERQRQLPRPFVYGGVIMASIAVVPIFLLARMRVDTFDKPRIHVVPDMDFQPKYKAQTANPFFVDGRSNRKPIPGTVPSGAITGDAHLKHGKTQEGDWVTTFPDDIEIDAELMARGRERFEITCAVCHGLAGDGDGLVAQRADLLQQGTWVPPRSLHETRIVEMPVGEIYNIVRNGKNTMAGYGSQLTVRDRWAITLYVKALQRSRTASLAEIPEERRDSLEPIPGLPQVVQEEPPAEEGSTGEERE